MERERKFKTIGIVSLIVAVIGLTVAFAALSQTLTINGTAKQEASTWLVVWEKLTGENFVTTGTAEVDEDYPTITNNGTNLNLGVITLKKPGDKVTYRVNMANNGDIDAMVTGVTGVTVNNTYVEYSVKYLDNNTNITAANGRLLAAGGKKLVLIEVKFKESVTTEEYNQILSEGIEVNLNGVSIEYSQNDGSAQADPEPVQQTYSFALNDLGTPTITDGILMYNSTSFSNINAVLEDSSYYVEFYDGALRGFYVTSSDPTFVNLSSINSYMSGGRGDVKGDESYRIMVVYGGDKFAVGIYKWSETQMQWEGIGNSDANNILSNYGDVVFTFTQPPSSFSE